MKPFSSSDSPSLPSHVPIVVFGDDWGRNVSTMQHLFQVIAATHKVIWINGIGHRVPSIGLRDLHRAAQKAVAMFRARAPLPPPPAPSGASPLRVIQPRVLPWHHIDLVRRYNTAVLTRTVRRVLQEEGLTTPPVVVTGTPPSAPAIGLLGETSAVYLCMDDYSHLPNVSGWMLKPLEGELLARVDATVATARSLTEAKRPHSGASYYLPQGVNWEHFARARPVPEELRNLPRPIIGFAGGVTLPCDFELLEAVAATNPESTVVLVGPVGVDFPGSRRPNVRVLGRREYADLPAFVQAFDVGLIPYHLNEHTLAVDPLKLLEYLAAGVPVVSTDLPEVRKYSTAVAVAQTRDEFLAFVSAACAEAGPTGREQRRAFAAQHSWTERARILLAILGETNRNRST